MKKFFAVIAVITLILCGCSAPAGIPDSTGAQPSDNGGQGILGFFSDIVDDIGNTFEKEEEPLLELGQGQKHQSLMILKITVNPKFELYLDMEGCVSRVRCLNKDAVTAFENMTGREINVIGLGYPDAMVLILDGMAQTGFLTVETKQIQIETTVHIEASEEDLSDLAAALAEPVEEYCAESELSLTAEVPVPEVDTEVSLEVPEYEVQTAKPNDVITYEVYDEKHFLGAHATYTEYYDENGKLYKLECYFDTGCYRIQEYGPNGNIIRYECLDRNGTITEKTEDDSGNTTKAIYTSADGSRTEYSYHDNGNCASSIITNPDGSISSESTFNKAGILVFHRWNPPDGNVHETTYNESGVPIYSKIMYADGGVMETSYYESGNRQSDIYDGPGSHIEWHYFEDGSSWSKYVENSAMGYNETIYYPSGQVAVRIGSEGEKRYNESGKLTYDKFDNGSTSYLYENGALVYLFIDGREITDSQEFRNFAIAYGFGS